MPVGRVRRNDTEGNLPICCRSEHFPNVIWPSLIEKAYATWRRGKRLEKGSKRIKMDQNGSKRGSKGPVEVVFETNFKAFRGVLRLRSTRCDSPRAPCRRTTWVAGRRSEVVARWRMPWRTSRVAWPAASIPRTTRSSQKEAVFKRKEESREIEI